MSHNVFQFVSKVHKSNSDMDSHRHESEWDWKEDMKGQVVFTQHQKGRVNIGVSDPDGMKSMYFRDNLFCGSEGSLGGT